MCIAVVIRACIKAHLVLVEEEIAKLFPEGEALLTKKSDDYQYKISWRSRYYHSEFKRSLQFAIPTMTRIIKQQGHTLLELLIALTLALFLSSVLIEIFVQCKKTYYSIQHLNAIQSSMLIAFNWLNRDIRMAGLIGCVRLIDFFPHNTLLLSPDNEFSCLASRFCYKQFGSSLFATR